VKAQARDRRKHQRHAVAIEVQVQTVSAGHASRPLCLDGVIVDLTEGGLRLIVFKMSKQDYLQMMNETRLPYVQIFCTFPGQPFPTRLFGKITYVDFRDVQPESCCQMGVRFGRMEIHDMKQLDAFIGSL